MTTAGSRSERQILAWARGTLMRTHYFATYGAYPTREGGGEFGATAWSDDWQRLRHHYKDADADTCLDAWRAWQHGFFGGDLFDLEPEG
jgi:hypothetical protein